MRPPRNGLSYSGLLPPSRPPYLARDGYSRGTFKHQLEMKTLINSISKFAINLMVKTIALAIEIHMTVTRIIRNPVANKAIPLIEDNDQEKTLGEQSGPAASGPDSHSPNGNCGGTYCCPADNFNAELRDK
jgi:hypothetical protein